MATDFSRRHRVTKPACYRFGVIVAWSGVAAILLSVLTSYTGDDILIPALAWPAYGVPAIVVGGIFIVAAFTKPAD